MSKVLVNETYLSEIADSIRSKNNTSISYKPSQMSGAIDNIPTFSYSDLQSKSVDPQTTVQSVVADEGYLGLSLVTVKPVKLQTKTARASLTRPTVVTADSEYHGLEKVTVDSLNLQSKTVVPNENQQSVTADSGYDGMSEVIIEAIPEPLMRDYTSENAIIGYNYPIDTYYNDSVTTLKGSAFANNQNIGNFVLNNLTTFAGTSNFYSCSAEKIIIPKCTGGSINTTFAHSTNLQLLDCSLSAIGAVNSFNNTPSLTTIIIRRNSVATLTTATGVQTLANGTCNIYVPDDLVDDYKNATNWLDFPDQIKPISELEEN